MTEELQKNNQSADGRSSGGADFALAENKSGVDKRNIIQGGIL